MTLWVATEWPHAPNVLMSEVHLDQDRMFICKEGLLFVGQGGKEVNLGKLLGFGADLDLLRSTLRLTENEIYIARSKEV